MEELRQCYPAAITISDLSARELYQIETEATIPRDDGSENSMVGRVRASLRGLGGFSLTT